MKNNLLNKEIWHSFEVHQNSLHEYIIKGSTIHGEQCLIRKKARNKWLFTLDGIPKSILKTTTVIEMLKSANIMLV